MIALKTRKEHLDVVVRRGKHASDRRLTKARNGDVILIAQTIDSLGRGQKQIAFAAVYDGSRIDGGSETLALWGKAWRYIIDLCDVTALRHPFNLSEVQISGKNYGQGAINWVYVEESDANAIISRGYLKPLVMPSANK